MVVCNSENRFIGKRDLIHIAILWAIALVIGVYLIATTVLISKDGVFYIERAQQFASDPIKIIKAHPPGYPFLIMVAHRCAALFADSTSVFTWIYAAQSVTLLCRLLALTPLYFIGKLLVGGKNSVVALLILIFLPYPTKTVCDVVREWPYLLFLATGFFFLLWSAKSGKWWLFGLVGLSSGLGYLIRPESQQLIVYGLLWVAISVCRPKLWGVCRWKTLTALVLLAIGFAIPTALYMKCTGQIIDPRIRTRIIKCFSLNSLPNKTDVPKESVVASNLHYNVAEIVPRNILKAFSELFESIGENLMWFFMLPLVIGLWYRLRGTAKFEEQFLITAFALANMAVMILQYCYNSPEISRRWTVSLIAVTVFYVPVGLQVWGNWLGSGFHRNQEKNERNSPLWFFILLVVGVSICLPKLFRPLGLYKNGYRTASKWLNKNTAPTDTVVVPDRRIAFYAQRPEGEMQRAKSAISAGQITSGSWFHLAGTFDGESQKLYVNGELVAAKKLMLKTLGESNNDLVIGKHSSGSTSYFEGVIDDVILYGRALSTEEIKSLHNNDVPGIESSELVGYCPLDGDTAGMDDKLNSAMSFNGTSDYIDLSDWSSRLNSDAITVSIWVKTELPNQSRWVISSRTQFRIGIIESKAYFWITEKSPGHEIPPKAAYVVEIINNSQAEWNPGFSKKVEEKYSTLVNNKKKKRRLVIYKVL